MMRSMRTLDLIYMCSKRRWTASLHPANRSCWNMKKAARTVRLALLWIGPSKNLLELVFYFSHMGLPTLVETNACVLAHASARYCLVELRSDAQGICTQACTQLKFDVHPHPTILADGGDNKLFPSTQSSGCCTIPELRRSAKFSQQVTGLCIIRECVHA